MDRRARERNRTADLRITSALLCRLSYAGALLMLLACLGIPAEVGHGHHYEIGRRRQLGLAMPTPTPTRPSASQSTTLGFEPVVGSRPS